MEAKVRRFRGTEKQGHKFVYPVKSKASITQALFLKLLQKM